jgi:hypothetical protein
MVVTHMLPQMILTGETVFPLSGALAPRTVGHLWLGVVLGVVMPFQVGFATRSGLADEALICRRGVASVGVSPIGALG